MLASALALSGVVAHPSVGTTVSEPRVAARRTLVCAGFDCINMPNGKLAAASIDASFLFGHLLKGFGGIFTAISLVRVRELLF